MHMPETPGDREGVTFLWVYGVQASSAAPAPRGCYPDLNHALLTISPGELLSNVVDDGLFRRRWSAPPHRQTAPQRSPWPTAARHSAAATSSRPLPSA